MVPESWAMASKKSLTLRTCAENGDDMVSFSYGYLYQEKAN